MLILQLTVKNRYREQNFSILTKGKGFLFRFNSRVVFEKSNFVFSNSSKQIENHKSEISFNAWAPDEPSDDDGKDYISASASDQKWVAQTGDTSVEVLCLKGRNVGKLNKCF